MKSSLSSKAAYPIIREAGHQRQHAVAGVILAKGKHRRHLPRAASEFGKSSSRDRRRRFIAASRLADDGLLQLARGLRRYSFSAKMEEAADDFSACRVDDAIDIALANT